MRTESFPDTEFIRNVSWDGYNYHHMNTPTNQLNPRTRLLSTATPYQLSGKLQNSDSFYYQLASFTTKVIAEGHYRFMGVIRRYRASLAYLNNDFKQTYDENLLDLMILAVLWNEHNGKWGKNMKSKERMLNQLFQWRTTLPSQKERLDTLRGKLASKWLNNERLERAELSLVNLQNLSTWLSATNEYNQEILRINSWLDFLSTIPETEVIELLKSLIEFGYWFKRTSKDVLGSYTHGVDNFLYRHQNAYLGKENYFFTGKKEVEYHLNMVGAEIMNRSLRNDFDKTKYKILLIPSCMKNNAECQAIDIVNGTVCRHCDKNCNISKTSNEMLNLGVHTFIVKHSTGFSKTLKQWANQNEIGIIGTACTLNLISGGLEMKKLNIPAQCVLLDYSGCKKHWTKEGIPTDINVSQIKSIVETKKSRAV